MSAPDTSSPVVPQSSMLEAMTADQRQNWKLTGKLPDDLAPAEPAPDTDDTSVALGSTDEASGQAPTPPEPDPTTPTPDTSRRAKADDPRHSSKARIKELTSERDRIAQERDDLKKRLEAVPAAPAQPAAPVAPVVTAPPAKPGSFKHRDGRTYDFSVPEDQIVQQFIQAGYADPYAAMSFAAGEYAAEQRLTAWQQEQTQRTQVQQVQAHREAIKARGQQKYKDFDQALSTSPVTIGVPLRDAFWGAIDRASNSEDVLYYLSRHPDEARVLAASDDPYAAVLMVGELSARLRTSAEPSPIAATPSAPAPPTALGTRVTAPSDEVEAAVAAGDFRRYRDAANRRDLAART